MNSFGGAQGIDWSHRVCISRQYHLTAAAQFEFSSFSLLLAWFPLNSPSEGN